MKPHIKLKVPYITCTGCKVSKTLDSFHFFKATRKTPAFTHDLCNLCCWHNGQRNVANAAGREAAKAARV